MHRYANPLRFQRLADAAFPYILTLAVVLTVVGLWGGLVMAPPDYQQGDAFRIMYVHVPTAWLALFVYLTLAIAAVSSIVWRHPLAEIYGRAAAPAGAVFCFLALVTGAIWGKPMWGTWWVWDARLTSMLILFFLYLGYSALYDAFDDPARGAKAAAIVALVGSVNLPIIKFSVDWWNTLHQPASVFRLDGPTIHYSMLWPLLVMAVAMKLYFLAVVILRTRAALTERKITNLRLTAETAGE
ncbi:MAG: heme ABC transporter permease [Geminicoccaceae bacterium]|nr:MAG: heme ABC transporter permease [Geminicoccaceae bacterium]